MIFHFLCKAAKLPSMLTIPQYHILPKNIVDLCGNLNRDLKYLKQWLHGNKLSLNFIKTQAMVVSSRPNFKISDKKVQPPTFSIDDSQIEIVEKAKYLRVQLDQHVVWDEHARFMSAKVSRALRFLKYTKKLLPQETVCIEVSLSHTSVTVALCGGSCGEARLLTQHKLQNRAARILTNSS